MNDLLACPRNINYHSCKISFSQIPVNNSWQTHIKSCYNLAITKFNRKIPIEENLYPSFLYLTEIIKNLPFLAWLPCDKSNIDWFDRWLMCWAQRLWSAWPGGKGPWCTCTVPLFRKKIRTGLRKIHSAMLRWCFIMK